MADQPEQLKNTEKAVEQGKNDLPLGATVESLDQGYRKNGNGIVEGALARFPKPAA